MKKRSEIEEKYKWNLKDMYQDSEEYKRSCAEIDLLTNKIIGMKGQITNSSENLYTYLETNDILSEKLEKMYVYSYLYHYQDMQDKVGLEYKANADKINDETNIKLSFTSSELMSAGFTKIQKFIEENNKLKKYAYALEKTFRYEKHVLSEKEEAIIAEAEAAFGTPDDAFSALDNVDLDLGYIKDEQGKKVKLTNSNYIKYMNSKSRLVRKNAFKNMYQFFASHINTISACYLGCVKEDFFESRVRKFNSPLEQSLFSDKIDVRFYQNFIEEIHRFLPKLYRYFKVREKALGYKNHMYDIYVDLAEPKDINIPYEKGKSIVLEALKPLGENYVSDLSKSFTEGWIDVYPNEYKRSGAYQWGSYGIHPYVSLNYENNPDSVSTLAHELGHAMHSFYSNKFQEHQHANYPIFLAEIASTVNEVLIDDYLYQHAESKEEKIVYLQNFLDKVRTTIFRQTMFAEFEMIIHEKYNQKEAITSDVLNDTYYELNKLYFGKNVIIDEDIKYEWARIPHFYTPFYVYKYATGLISALSIASDILNKVPGSIEKYLDFLSAGGSDYPLETLKKAGVDITSGDPIKKAFQLFEEKLLVLEQLVNEKGEKHE